MRSCPTSRVCGLNDTIELTLSEELYEPKSGEWVGKVALEPRRARLLLKADG
jgi:hypothetical protein